MPLSAATTLSAMQTFPAEALLALAALLLAAGGVAGAVVLVRRYRRRTPGGGGELPACGRCGYAVAGLPSFTCPECGSDLRDVGIVRGGGTAGGGGRGRAVAIAFFRAVGWKLAAFAAVWAWAGFLAIDHYLDRVRPTTWVETSVVRARPRSGAFKSVAVTLTERTTTAGYNKPPDAPAASRVAKVEAYVGPERFEFERDTLAGVNRYVDAAGVERTNRRPVGQDLGEWLAGHGVDVARRGVREELDVIADAITHSNARGGFWDIMANRATERFDRETAYTNHDVENRANRPLLASAAAAVGVAGLVAIWLRNRRRLAAAVAEARGGSAGAVAEAVPDEIESAAPDAVTTRTLSVMFSDVKDYTARTAGASRLGVLDLVRRHAEVAHPVIRRRGGRLVKSLGDGLLVTFESATDAVLAGLEIQAAAAAHNASADGDGDRLELRIAVSTGEVTLSGGDVFGEAVNLASRAQQHAPPGEVWFTEATRATVNRREVRLAEAGTFDLKGVPEPVRLYRALPLPDPAAVPAALATDPATG